MTRPALRPRPGEPQSARREPLPHGRPATQRRPARCPLCGVRWRCGRDRRDPSVVIAELIELRGCYRCAERVELIEQQTGGQLDPDTLLRWARLIAGRAPK